MARSETLRFVELPRGEGSVLVALHEIRAVVVERADEEAGSAQDRL